MNAEITDAAVVHEETPSRWEDFIDLLYAPAAVFERRRGATFGWPLAILAVLLAALVFVNMTVLAPLYEAEIRRSIESAGQGAAAMDPAQMASMGRIFGVVGFLIFFPISVLLVALVLWGGAKVLGAGIAFATAGVVATYSQLPIVFQQLAAIIQGLVLDVRGMEHMHSVSLGVARFLPADSNPVLLALAGRLELFALWSVILMTIGLAVTARISRGAAFAVAAVVWLLSGLPEMIGALFR